MDHKGSSILFLGWAIKVHRLQVHGGLRFVLCTDLLVDGDGGWARLCFRLQGVGSLASKTDEDVDTAERYGGETGQVMKPVSMSHRLPPKRMTRPMVMVS